MKVKEKMLQKLRMWGHRESENGANICPHPYVALRGVLNPGDTASVVGVGEGLNTGTIAVVPVAPSLKPYNPFFKISFASVYTGHWPSARA